MNQNGGNPNNPPSRVVYLGSLPYDQTEQQILDLCRNVGPVSDMKMMFDPQTGKSKGYAFVEFKDLESSASAIRNLDRYQLGSRFLRCSYANGNDLRSATGMGGPGNSGSDQMDGMGSNPPRFADLPSGIDVNINMTTPAMMISSELSKLDKTSQLDLLRGFQEWAKTDSENVTVLLAEYPQLTYVIAELMLTNGIAKVDDLTRLAANNSNDANNNTGKNEEDSKLSDDPEVQQKQKMLLKQVLQLNDSEISILSDDERMTLWDLKQRAMRGEFGALI